MTQTDNPGEFRDAALVLIGHGSTLNSDSALPTWQHADAIRARNVFGEVMEGFWKQEPFLAGVLRGTSLPRVFVVPLFISEGYFTEQVIPRELGLATPRQPDFPRVQRRGGQTIHYCGPVGTHPSMTRVILARASEIVHTHPGPAGVAPRASSLFVAGHGTGNNENSRKAIEAQVAIIRDLGLYNDVHAVFMEEDPRIADCCRLAGTDNIVMVPFFISDGLHSFEDIPVLLGESPEEVRSRLQRREPTWRNPTLRDGKWIWYTRSVGEEAHLQIGRAHV